MAYTPTQWTTGDTITATKMNKLENGVANAGSALICNFADVDGNYILDKTVQEIYDALLSGTPAYITYQYGTLPTDFVSNKYFTPIIKVYGYQYADIIRIVASWTLGGSVSTGTGDYLNIPGVIIFSAESLSEYPIFYRRVCVNTTALHSDQSIL